VNLENPSGHQAWRVHSRSAADQRFPQLWWIVPVTGSAGALLLFHLFASSYLLHQGFPLDDSWIHAVYAREFARTGLLAYNPGVPATGETSPLWALFLAIPHKLVGSGPGVVMLTKFAGFGLHVAAAVVLGFALRSVLFAGRSAAIAAAGLVAVHPDLVAASVSGMEVPLATLVSAAMVVATFRGHAWSLFLLGAMAFLARPETALIACTFPFLFRVRTRPVQAAGLAAAAGLGGAAALGVLAWRNLAVSGLPLPATFYVKANRGSLLDPAPLVTGFVDLLGQVAALNSVLVLAVLGCAALYFLSSPHARSGERAAAAMCGTGLVFCAVSFVLIPPADPGAFYHQRYVLPAVPMLVAALPLMLDGLAARFVPRFAPRISAFTGVALAVVLLAAIPAKARRVSNDARNIDDVQVAFGRALADASVTDVLWAIDAGASRYFGRPFVVDLMALNSPELLRPDAASFISGHQPRYLDLFPDWSRLDPDTPGLPTREFGATTPYTVTSFPAMRVHYLSTCTPPGLTGRLWVRGRWFPFVCPP